MPTLLLLNGIRYFFYSNENNESIHVHVTKGNANGKIWLEPLIRIKYMDGFSNAEQKDILEVINKYALDFKQKWNEYFSK